MYPVVLMVPRNLFQQFLIALNPEDFNTDSSSVVAKINTSFLQVTFSNNNLKIRISRLFLYVYENYSSQWCLVALVELGFGARYNLCSSK